MALLEVENVVVRFGGIVALDGVTFDIPEGQIVGLIGPNGAGKTTLFNCLSRLYTPNEGDVRFRGETVLNKSADSIAALGIGRTFQNLALFPTLSVLNNVMIGGHCRTKSSFVANAFRVPSVRQEEGEHAAGRCGELRLARREGVLVEGARDGEGGGGDGGGGEGGGGDGGGEGGGGEGGGVVGGGGEGGVPWGPLAELIVREVDLHN